MNISCPLDKFANFIPIQNVVIHSQVQSIIFQSYTHHTLATHACLCFDYNIIFGAIYPNDPTAKVEANAIF
jgi:hypothetical protein